MTHCAWKRAGLISTVLIRPLPIKILTTILNYKVDYKVDRKYACFRCNQWEGENEGGTKPDGHQATLPLTVQENGYGRGGTVKLMKFLS